MLPLLKPKTGRESSWKYSRSEVEDNPPTLHYFGVLVSKKKLSIEILLN